MGIWVRIGAAKALGIAWKDEKTSVIWSEFFSHMVVCSWTRNNSRDAARRLNSVLSNDPNCLCGIIWTQFPTCFGNDQSRVRRKLYSRLLKMGSFNLCHISYITHYLVVSPLESFRFVDLTSGHACGQEQYSFEEQKRSVPFSSCVTVKMACL